MVLNKAMLRLVTGEDVHYDFCDDWIEADTILMEIKDKPFIKVTDKKDRVLTFDGMRQVCLADKPDMDNLYVKYYLAYLHEKWETQKGKLD